MLVRGVIGMQRQPLRALGAIPTAIPNLLELPGANAFPGGAALSGVLSRIRRALGRDEDEGVLEVTTARPPRTSFNGPVSAHRRFAFGSLSLDSVKALKNRLGITVNDATKYTKAGIPLLRQPVNPPIFVYLVYFVVPSRLWTLDFGL